MPAGSTGVVKSGVADVDALIVGTKWDTLKLSYSFFAPEDFPSEPIEGFEPLAERERLVAESIFKQVSSFTNLEFAQAATSAGGDIRWGSGEMDPGGYAGYPGVDGGGDIWINLDTIHWGFSEPGDFLGYTFMHEIGHALGLKHGHEFPALSPEHNGHEFSLMTYGSYIGQPQDLMYAPREENGGYPQTFMMYDIAALQHMYGANFSYNSGNTVYSWDPETGRMSVDGVGQATPLFNRIFMTLWDGGGTDTYDFSNYAEGVKVDLRPGGWTTTSQSQLVDLNYQGWDVPPTYARGNIANALSYQGDRRSLIENAIGGVGDDDMTGNAGANRLTGGGGNDRLSGGAGDDLLDGGLGDDVLIGDAGTDLADYGSAGAAVTIDLALTTAQQTGAAGADLYQGIEGAAGSAFADRLLGGSAADILRGADGDDRLDGRAGDDMLDGGAGEDLLDGGEGSDTASYASARTAVSVNLAIAGAQETGGGGLDTLSSIENVAGSAFADRLRGTAAANRIDGAGSADTMNGGAGDDIYVVDRASDRVVELASGGTDTVWSWVTVALASHTENLVLLGTTAIGGTGNAAANKLTGNDSANLLQGGQGADVIHGGGGNDRLDGGLGADGMSGGDGDDIYLIDQAGDRVVERSRGGNDTVISSVSHTLGAYFEQLALAGAAAVNGTGNGLANILTGNQAANQLNGGDGNDVVEGGLGDDRLSGGRGVDTATYASASAAVAVDLSAGGAQDTLGSGLDTLVSIENLTGSAHADRLAGNDQANRLDGGQGADRLIGAGGDDILLGGSGIDIMYGGAGGDRFVVDNGSDRTVELAGGGYDTVESSASFTLKDNLEKLVLTGTGAISGTGNAEDNHLVGNGARNTLRGLDGDDRLDGGGGADTLAGGAGDDVYLVDDSADSVREISGEGRDTILAASHYALADGAAVEVLRAIASNKGISLTGNSAANELFGGAFGDNLYGGGGNDVLSGGRGSDLFIGGAGADTFRFAHEEIGQGAFAADRIGDFASGTDEIDLAAIDANLGKAGDQAFTFIGERAFSGAAGELRCFVAEGGVIVSGQFLWIEGDVNGDGAADFHLILTGGNLPVGADFIF